MDTRVNTLIDLFDTFRGRGGATAFVYRTGVRRFVFSYADLDRLARQMAGRLAAQGIEPGDRVAIWAPNSPWWAVAFWGCVVQGVVVVPIDFMAGRERAEKIIENAGVKIVIQSQYKLDKISNAQFPIFNIEDLEYLIACFEPTATSHQPKPEDVAELIYTSGTTGDPKGVMLTHKNLVSNLVSVNEHIPVITSEWKFLSVLPLSHMFEQMGGFLTPLYRGGAIVYVRTLKPTAIMEALKEERIWVMVLVPRLLQALKTSIERELASKHLSRIFNWLQKCARALSREKRTHIFSLIHKKFGGHLHMFVSGGAALSADLFNFWNTLGFRVLEGYGLTECSPVLAAHTFDEQIPGSVGKVLPRVALRIKNNEILAMGDNIFPGYYHNEEATQKTFTDDGWFKTGDIGSIDEDGLIRLKGRAKEMIVTSAGINVYPDDIEPLLNVTPGVKEACVIGVDKGHGEEVYAVLILDESGRKTEDIIQEVNTRLDPLQHITSFSLWPEKEFPKTTTLKIQKFKVKQFVTSQQFGNVTIQQSDRLISIIANITGKPADLIHEGTFLVSDLGLTSIARLELANALELEYRLDLEDTSIDETTTVSRLRMIVEKRERHRHSTHYARFWTTHGFVRRLAHSFDTAVFLRFFRHYVTLNVQHLDRLVSTPYPVIFISNHISYFDHPAIHYSLPPEVRFKTATAAREEFFFKEVPNFITKVVKRIAYETSTTLLNVFMLPQTRGFRHTLRYMGKLIDHGVNILIFPEGSRSWDSQMLPFQHGLGLLVKELKVPVVPIRLRGLEKVFPRGAKWPRKGSVIITFGTPLTFTTESPSEILEKSRQAILAL